MMRNSEKFLNDRQIYLNGQFRSIKCPLLVWMTIFDFKVWPRLFSRDDATFGFTEIENLANVYLEHKLFTPDETSDIPKEWPLLRSCILHVPTL